MANILDDLAVHIAALLPTEEIRKGYYTDAASTPNRLIFLTVAEPGLEPLDTMGTSIGTIGIERPLVQVITRGEPDDYQESFDLCISVYTSIHNTVNTTINGTFYYLIEAIQYPFSLKQDQNARWLTVFNILIHKEPN